jgi:hypothetical protein
MMSWTCSSGDETTVTASATGVATGEIVADLCSHLSLNKLIIETHFKTKLHGTGYRKVFSRHILLHLMVPSQSFASIRSSVETWTLNYLIFNSSTWLSLNRSQLQCVAIKNWTRNHSKGSSDERRNNWLREPSLLNNSLQMYSVT